MADRTCTVDGCSKAHHSHGLCSMHAQRLRRHGDPLTHGCRIVGDDVARFESYLSMGVAPAHAPDLGPCWLWTGGLTKDGYAIMASDLPTDSAHRWSYRHHIGPLPDGLEMDHLCVVAHCVNPWHLDPVPHAENVRRVNARKTHCPQGHEYTEANTRWQRNGTGRVCRTCQRQWDQTNRRSA